MAIYIYQLIITILLLSCSYVYLKKFRLDTLFFFSILFIHISAFSKSDVYIERYGSEIMILGYNYILIFLLVYIVFSQLFSNLIMPSNIYNFHIEAPSNFHIILLFLIFFVLLFFIPSGLYSDLKYEQLGSSEFTPALSAAVFFAYSISSVLGVNYSNKRNIYLLLGGFFAIFSTILFEGRVFVYIFGGSFIMSNIILNRQVTRIKAFYKISLILLLGYVAGLILRIVRYVNINDILNIDISDVISNIDFSGSESDIYGYYFELFVDDKYEFLYGSWNSFFRFFLVPFPSSIVVFKPQDVTHLFAEYLCYYEKECARSVPQTIFGEAIFNGGYYFSPIFIVFFALIVQIFSKILFITRSSIICGPFVLFLMYSARGWFDGGLIAFTSSLIIYATIAFIDRVTYKFNFGVQPK
jgi:hypothetical protein